MKRLPRKKSKMHSKEFDTCQQWQHKQSKECVMIMSVTPYVMVSPNEDFNINFLTESGCRMNMAYSTFKMIYVYIPKREKLVHAINT